MKYRSHPIDINILKVAWFKFDNFKQLELHMDHHRGCLAKKAAELGLPLWTERIGYLIKNGRIVE